MTTPNDPRWSENPQPGPGGWQQPEYGQPQYGDPQYGPTPQLGSAPQHGADPQHGAEELLEPHQPQRPRARGRTIAVAAAAVVLLGGGVATYAAVSSSGAGGSATPTQAVQKIFADLGRSDLIGMLDDLPPAERDAIAKPVQDTLTELQHEGIIAPNANLNHLAGVQFRPSNLTFAPKTITINNHVQIVQLTGGTISFTGDATKLPLAGSLLRRIEAHGGGPTHVHRTLNITQEVRSAGQPIRIAAQKVDGRWYPSLLYTIADNVTTQAGLGTPNPADAIPARGASSPDAAVRGLITNLVSGRVEHAIELTSPDEDAVLHDYGKFIVDRVHYGPVPAHINSIGFTDRPISGGTEVILKSIDLTVQGQRVSFKQEGNCFEVQGMGQDQRLCRGDIARMIRANGMPAAEQRAVEELTSGSYKAGVVTTESGGKWYVNPIRTVLGLAPKIVPFFGAIMQARGVVGAAHGGGGWPGVIPSAVASPTR